MVFKLSDQSHSITSVKQHRQALMKIALPAMVENFLQMLVSSVDTYLVAQLGTVAVSGVALASHVLTVYQAVFIALGISVSSLIAKHHAKQDEVKLKQTIQMALQLTFWVSLVMSILSIFGGSTLLTILGAQSEVIETGALYLAWVGGASLTLGGLTTLGAVFRARHLAKVPMYISILVNLLNLFLSALAIFVLKWGVIGAALGTVLARLIGVVIMLYPLRVELIPWVWRLDVSLLGQALPTTGERLMMRIGDVAVVGLVIKLGTEMVAGQAIGEVITQFNYLPGLSLATAVVILTAQATDSQIKAIYKEGYVLAFQMMGLIAGIVWLLSPFLVEAFTLETKVQVAIQIVIIASFLSTPITAATLMIVASWQGLGQAKLPFYATSIGMWLVRFGLGSVMVLVFRWGLWGVYIATSLDNAFRWLFLAYMFKKKR